MFQSSAKRLRAWLTLVDDVLADPLADQVADARAHPHRRPLRWQRGHRPGTVPARPAVCLSPVRPAPVREPTQHDRTPH